MTSVYSSVTGIGVDVHHHFSLARLCDSEGQLVAQERLNHDDRQVLRRHLKRWPKGATVVMEASFGWGWLSDLMTEVGLKVRLANCFKVEKMRQARGIDKNNEKDAFLLSELLHEKRNWWEVWRAPLDVRRRREVMRHRADLVALQTATKNRIHAVFHRFGVFHPFSDLFGRDGRAFLESLVAGGQPQSEHLVDEAMAALRDELSLLKQVRTQLADVAQALRHSLERTQLCRFIKSVPGFGLVLAHVVIAEIGMISRFRKASSLAAYSLLAPRCDDTGEPLPTGKTPIGRHLGQRGNRTLKWAFIEAAHAAVRKGGVWAEMFNRLTHGGKQNRQRGYIAVARALVNVVHAVWREGRLYQDRSQPQEQSSKRRRSRSSMERKQQGQKQAHPGTGRLYHTMVTA
jgi:transposase